MELIYKEIPQLNRSMYLYFPAVKMHSPFRRYAMTILREDDSCASAMQIMEKYHLKEWADRECVIISFPNPTQAGWNYQLEKDKPEDAKAIAAMQYEMSSPGEHEFKLNAKGIPAFECMVDCWHLMNDTRYFVGFGTGASMLYSMAAVQPENMAAILCVGGKLEKSVAEHALGAPIPACLCDTDTFTKLYFIQYANHAECKQTNGNYTIYSNVKNPLEQVWIENVNNLNDDSERSDSLIIDTYNNLMKKVRRTNTGLHGDIEARMDLGELGFELYLDDTRLGDNGGMGHTWFVHVPDQVKQNPQKKVPLMVFMHGGSDNPSEAAQMSNFHELGNEEGFITVYPWGSNTCSWNSDMDEEEYDDTEFIKCLIEEMIRSYPVDASRVYLSGFSNGAAQAQVNAMVHPEMIAGVCHIDSNWPGKRLGVTEIHYDELKPYALGLQKKKEYDYRMPVWYTYGSREPSYPVYKGCSQQNQYDFWKMYNHIEVKPTPTLEEVNPCGCGVEGENREFLTPSKRHPQHVYEVNRFYATDSNENLYNYVLMHDKGHEVAEMDARLGWNFVKQFCRNEDGSLGRVNR